MPRPQKNGLDYFPLDVDFLTEPKVKILKARYGSGGIAAYVYLLCAIYREGYYIRCDDDFLYTMSDDLKLGFDMVKQVLTFLLERSLFNNILFQSDAVLTSAGIQKRFQLAVAERAKKTPIEVKGFWLLEEAETKSFIKVNPILNSSPKKEDNSRNNSHNSPDLSLKESKGKKRKVEESKENKGSSVTYVPDERLNQTILDYIDYCKKIKKPMAERAVELLIQKLGKLSRDPDEQIEILNQSIVNGWQGIFPLKENNQRQGSSKSSKSYDDMLREWAEAEDEQAGVFDDSINP